MPKHPGSIDRHGDCWRLRLCVGGRRHTFSFAGVRKTDVEQFAREKDAELRRRVRRGLPGHVPFSEVLAAYRQHGMTDLSPNSLKTYGTSLDAFETYFVREGNDPSAHDIGQGDVNAFLDWRRLHGPNGKRRKEPLSARSVDKDRVVLHIVFEFALGRDLADVNPVAKTKPRKGDQREPLILDKSVIGDTGPEYEALIAACDGRPMLRTYVLVLGEAGLRCDSEALWLRWADVDLESGFLTVESVRKGRRTKSGKSRKVPMTRRLRDALGEHMATFRLRTYHGARTSWVFHHEIDRRHAKAGERLGSLRRAFYGAAKRAGLPQELNQHDLRHRRVTTWLGQGKPIHLVRQAMGHSTVRVTEDTCIWCRSTSGSWWRSRHRKS